MVFTTSSMLLCLCVVLVFFARWKGLRSGHSKNPFDRPMTLLSAAFGIDLLLESVFGTTSIPLVQATGDLRLLVALMLGSALKITLLLVGTWQIHRALKQMSLAPDEEDAAREAALQRAEAERARQAGEVAHAAHLAELERRAARTDCPACGQNFAYALARCSGCGLKFQAE